MSEQDKGFRVIDRRGDTSGPSTEENKDKGSSEEAGQADPVKEGEGFSMKDSPDQADPETSGAPDQIDFSTLVFSLATQSLVSMGLTPDPQTKEVAKNLPLAKQNIDILSMLQEKTKGNLTDEEEKLLEGLLAEVRLRFVEASRLE